MNKKMLIITLIGVFLSAKAPLVLKAEQDSCGMTGKHVPQYEKAQKAFDSSSKVGENRGFAVASASLGASSGFSAGDRSFGRASHAQPAKPKKPAKKALDSKRILLDTLGVTGLAAVFLGILLRNPYIGIAGLVIWAPIPFLQIWFNRMAEKKRKGNK